ncbi:uncharacterized protein LOC116197201 [Punica granatum]|uniref:Uncharacterized protein LOC116197201 n=1 Tax=Punica granatum TaxID=22663 RepID=A0A6P8CNX6_PUNGR|nr:uncharacterized protein LOC116197201 [Punica granatum]
MKRSMQISRPAHSLELHCSEVAGAMKFEDLLMERSEESQQRADLENEVLKLQAELEGEQALNRALNCALHGPVTAHPCLSSLLPPQVQKLFSELAMVEEEIVWLERKVEEMKLRLYEERKRTKDWQMMLQPRARCRAPPNHLFCSGLEYGPNSELKKLDHRPVKLQNSEEKSKHGVLRQRRASVGSASDIQSMSSSRSNEEITEKPRKNIGRSIYPDPLDSAVEKPNELSEELIKCLIEIFLELNRSPQDYQDGNNNASKLALTCMTSKSFTGRTSFSNDNPTNLDPYGIFSDSDGTSFRDVGPYRNFIQITRGSLEISRFPECLLAIRKLRALLQKLCDVDLTFLTYKQKLAFWINIYNACVMHVLHF